MEQIINSVKIRNYAIRIILAAFIISMTVYTPIMAQNDELDIAGAYKDSYKYEKSGNYTDAFRVLIPVLEKYPTAYTVNYRLGWISTLMKKYKDAVEFYKKAEIASPYSLEVKTRLAYVYLAKEEWTQAEKKCVQIITIDYYNYYGNYYLGLSYKNQKKYKAAESITRKILAVYPTDIMYLNELGILLYLQEKHDDSAEIFNNVIILDPENITAKKYLNKKSEQ